MLSFDSKNKTILIFAHHGLGDLIMLLPSLGGFLTACRNQYSFIVAVRGTVEKKFLLDLNLGLHAKEIYVLKKYNFAGRLPCLMQLIVYCLPKNIEYFLPIHFKSFSIANLISIIIRAKKRSVNLLKKQQSMHKTKYYFSHFVHLGLLDNDLEVNYPNVTNINSNNNHYLNKYIVLCPAVGADNEQHKSWGDLNFLRCAELITTERRDINVAIMLPKGSKSSLEFFTHSIISKYEKKITIMTFDTPYEALGLLKNSLLVISNCSGAIHMASMVGANIIGLYGPTDPHITGPISSSVVIISEKIECSPCYEKGLISGCGNPVCMKKISTKRVMSYITKVIDKNH